MPEPIVLPVTRCEQLPGLCGAATAQMILHFKGLTGPTVETASIVAEIQANTAGQRPRGKIHEHDCPAFDNQKRERCTNDLCTRAGAPTLEPSKRRLTSI